LRLIQRSPRPVGPLVKQENPATRPANRADVGLLTLYTDPTVGVIPPQEQLCLRSAFIQPFASAGPRRRRLIPLSGAGVAVRIGRLEMWPSLPKQGAGSLFSVTRRNILAETRSLNLFQSAAGEILSRLIAQRLTKGLCGLLDLSPIEMDITKIGQIEGIVV